MDLFNQQQQAPQPKTDPNGLPEDYPQFGWAVDGSCFGTGTKSIQYRIVDLFDRTTEIYRSPVYEAGSSNLAEFLAIVHALAEIKNKGYDLPVYSDSLVARTWIRNISVNTSVRWTPENKKLYGVYMRALKWIKENTDHAEVKKWHTKKWGEIPADFGRK